MYAASVVDTGSSAFSSEDTTSAFSSTDDSVCVVMGNTHRVREPLLPECDPNTIVTESLIEQLARNYYSCAPSAANCFCISVTGLIAMYSGALITDLPTEVRAILFGLGLCGYAGGLFTGIYKAHNNE